MSAPSYFQHNTIYCGDCRDVLRLFPEKSVDLIYADPPFFTNEQYEVIWKDGSEVRAFEDRWKGGIENYIGWMNERVEQCYRVLKDTGSMYLHCDPHASHYLKVEVMDKLFQSSNFRNEIIWQRTHAHGGGETGFSRVHDNILFYSKSKDFTFNRQHVPYSEKYIENFFRFTEPDGRRYRLVITTGSGESKNDYKWKGKNPTKGRHWAYAKEKMEELDKNGLLVYSKNGIPNVKQYLDEKEGTLVTDIWNDIEVIHSQSKERLGYPTQKPESLLERIVKSSSDAMDIVLDPFCGCGTAIAVAHRQGRRWIGIDVSPTACNLMAQRMRRLGAKVLLMGMPLTEDDLMKLQHFDFQNWVVQRLHGRVSSRKSSDMGIDGYTFEGYPIQVKQSENVGRNAVDNFETAIRRSQSDTGIIVALSFGRGAHEEVARAKIHEGLSIRLMTAKELADNSDSQQTK
ncbi:MAG TPA: DNA methyltransferase, partial [Nitrososphaerales archaeon]|nr:DNA methyltransferase [Nitrososphaerales archaeon]